MFNYGNATQSPSTFSHSTPEELLELGIDKIRTAFSQRVLMLESEVNELNFVIKERDNKLMEANNAIKRLETELNDQNMKMRILQEEKSKAQQETYEVTQTVRKLRVDVSKLQAFKKSIIDSFDGDDIVKTGNLMGTIISSPTHSSTPSLSSTSFPRNYSPYRSLSPILDNTKPNSSSPSQSMYASRSNSPAQSPHESKLAISPPPLTTSQLNSQHNHTLQSSNTKSSPLFSPTPSPTPNSIHNNTSFNNSVTSTSTPNNNNNQLEGKEFFKQARQRLDYDKFNELISGIKKLNGHLITTDQCLETAWDIFGDQNTDLYYSFKKMLIK